MAAFDDAKEPEDSFSDSLCDLLEQLREENSLKKFRNIGSDEERVKFCCDHPRIRKCAASWMSKYNSTVSHKSHELAHKHRMRGNAEFQKKKYLEAVESYTLSILHAPHICDLEEEPPLAMGYANRSAAFYHIRKYQTCLDDIDRAFDSDYPDSLLYKLYIRKANCLSYLNRPLKIIEEAVSTALNSVDGSECLATEYKECLKKEMNKLLARPSCKLKCDSSTKTLLHSDQSEELPAVSYGQHSNLAYASSALEVHYSAVQGRYIVANRPIKAGDVLFVEKPFASVVLPDHYQNHCHHCCAILEVVIPCIQCSQVRYCSEDCRKKSYEQYHRIECGYLDLLHAMGLDHLVLRVILVAGLPYLLESKQRLKELESQSSIHGWNDGKHYGESYETVYSLVTHAQDMDYEDVLCYAISSTVLLQLLDGELERVGATAAQKLFIGSLILRHTEQLICNAYAITELLYDEKQSSSLVESGGQKRIATAVYVVANLMNHACKPNIISSFFKNTLIVRATEDVPVGGELLNCYGPYYHRMPRDERQELLRMQYYFVCCCKLCVEGDDDESIFKALKCLHCGGPLKAGVCRECHKAQDCKEMLRKSSDASLLLEQASESVTVEKSLKLAKKCLQIHEEVSYKYHEGLSECLDLLALNYIHLGFYKKAAFYLRRAVEITEKRYGADSIELANELEKLASVLTQELMRLASQYKDTTALSPKFDEALDIVKRALKIFQTCYGSTHPSTKSMQERLEFLSEGKEVMMEDPS